MSSKRSDPEKGESDPLIAGKEDADGLARHGSFQDDAMDTIKLGVPIFITMLSWVGMKTTDSALLGHVSAEALAASSLSDLWTMCSAVLIQGRVLGILVGAAVGAGNPKLAGIYLQVSYLVLSILAVGVFVAWNFTEQVWVTFGTDPVTSRDAGYYARVLSISIPGLVAFSQLSQFFSAQRIMYPELNASSAALLLNLVFGLILVLGVPFPNFDGFGFQACPIITMLCVYVQLAVVYFIYVKGQRLHEPCWGGWSWNEITYDRVKTFSALYFPSALGTASDFWRVAVIGAVAANLGEMEVAVFNTSYRIMWITLILINALSSASGIKMSMRLGKLNHIGAKQAGHAGLALCFITLCVVSLLVLWQARTLGAIFTNDEEFLQLFDECRVPFTVVLFLMNLSIAIEKIPYSMGRTSDVFWMGVIASWGFQVPGVFVCTTYWRNDLNGLYSGMAIGYFALCILYGIIAFSSDWEKYAQLARSRSEASE